VPFPAIQVGRSSSRHPSWWPSLTAVGVCRVCSDSRLDTPSGPQNTTQASPGRPCSNTHLFKTTPQSRTVHAPPRLVTRVHNLGAGTHNRANTRRPAERSNTQTDHASVGLLLQSTRWSCFCGVHIACTDTRGTCTRTHRDMIKYAG
jgi:hypothetical protein